MNEDEARAHVSDALAKVAPEIDLSTVAPEAPLREELELDSLDFLAFVEALSTSTGVRLEEADYSRLATIRSSLRLLQERTATAS